MKEYWNKLSFGQKVKLIFFAIVGLLVIIFAFLNWKVFNLNLIFGKIEVPVTILILVSMFGGYSYARVYGWMKGRKQDREISYLKGELAATREKLRKEPLESKLSSDQLKTSDDAEI
jgi:uncharacterized integral membrane protein